MHHSFEPPGFSDDMAPGHNIGHHEILDRQLWQEGPVTNRAVANQASELYCWTGALQYSHYLCRCSLIRTRGVEAHQCVRLCVCAFLHRSRLGLHPGNLDMAMDMHRPWRLSSTTKESVCRAQRKLRWDALGCLRGLSLGCL